MIDGMGETGELTMADLKGLRAPHIPELTADLLRQQAGVGLVDVDGKTVGSEKLAQEAEKMVWEGGLKPAIDPITGEKNRDRVVIDKANAWLTHEQVVKEGLPVLQVEKEQLGTMLGLLGVRDGLKQAVGKYMSQGGDERLKLVELISSSADLAYDFRLSRAKMEVLLSLDDLDGALSRQLTTLRDFFDADVLSLVSVSADEEREMDERIQSYLARPRESSNESYKEKAARVLGVVREGVLRGEVSKRSSADLLTGLTRAEARSLPLQVHGELLSLASRVNHVRLLERLEEAGLDLPALRHNMAEKLAALHREPKPADREAVVNSKAYQELAELIAKVTNTIAELFPHDTVYLLGQMLTNGEAVCAGKAMAAVMVLEDLGLKARYVDVSVRLDSEYLGNHAMIHVKLPNGIRLMLDLNTESVQEKNGERGFDHLADWLVPQGLLPPERNLREAIGQARENRECILQSASGPVVMAAGKYSHRLVSEARRSEWDFAVFNLAVTMLRDPKLWAVEYGGVETVMKAAWDLMIEAVRINPRDDAGLNMLSVVIGDQHALFEKKYGGEDGLWREVYRLRKEAVRLNPYNDVAMYNLSNVIDNHPALFQDLYGGEDGLRREVYRLRKEAVRLNPNNDSALNNLSIVIDLHSALFKEQFGGEDGLRREVYRLRKEAVRLNPNSGAANYNLGRAVLDYLDVWSKEDHIAKITEAIAAFRRFIELVGESDSRYRRKAQSDIEILRKKLTELELPEVSLSSEA